MEALIKFLTKQTKIANIINNDNDLTGVNDESLLFGVALKYLQKKELTIIVANNMLHAQNIYSYLSGIIKDDLFLYCVDEVTKFTSLASSPELIAQRIVLLNKLANDEPIFIITHTMAIKRLTPNIEIFKNSCINLKIGQTVDALQEKVIKLGYKNVLKVTQPFEFSSRGGVIDIYSINYSMPIRIEFFDKEIDSIRFFDVDSQRTISLTDQIEILPASEFLTNSFENGINNIKKELEIESKNSPNNLQLMQTIEEDIDSIMQYDFNDSIYKYYSFFSNYSTLLELINSEKIYFLDYNAIKDNEKFIEEESMQDIQKQYERGMSLNNLKLFEQIDSILEKIKKPIYLSTDVNNSIIDLNFIKVDSFDFSFDILYKELIEKLSEHYYIYIGLQSDIHYNSLISFLNAKELDFNEIDETKILSKGINISHNDYHIGLDLQEFKIEIIGEKEIFNKRFKSTINNFSKYKNAVTISSVNDLSVGDYLVHEYHGIGIYKGIETILQNNIHRDYLKIEYKNNAMLYLPLEQFKLVRKYVSKEGAVPHINTLGSKEWEKTKAKIKERVNELAARLVKLYSLRAEKTGFSFEKDDDLQIAFENDFPYELTGDQKKVMQEIKEDMERPIIMDRILVGDVGFGKTEVALRAAFKAINSGKQVALLCPTTLLARQHYMTSLDRFRNFGVNIRLLSRLVSESDTKQILKDLKEGKVDLLIGTHRLLSSDIVFKDLGLLIVDEEHKFGVEHKEKIKEIKQNVDVLTLSATPIPRTLQMALTGVRGFSTITTPIENRMPVQTYVITKDDYLIKEIIERELARGGQVFYLNNKIEKLPEIANKLQKMIPNAKIAIAHGKLPIDKMEDIMQRFILNEYNILLCTTIIENGIDIPNVNTILVDNADCFGLSQLYQIKGRVGRGDRLGYAYLMYAPNKQLSDVAKKRLNTIKEFASLGSGYKVAMRDLLTRGAGDMLGQEQSGFIDSVGIDMYIEMLHDAIEKKKQGIEDVEEKPNVIPNKTLSIDAYIPENYYSNDYEKIDLYKQIDKVNSLDQLSKLKEETIDKTGKLPKSIDMIFEKKSIDLIAKEGIISSYEEFNDFVSLKIDKSFNTLNGIGIKIFELANNISNTINLRFNKNQIEAQIKKKDDWIYIMSTFIRELKTLKKSYEDK